MTTLREAAAAALEALEMSTPKARAEDDYAEQGWEECQPAITALRTALAEPQEPVAWRYWSTKWHCWEYSDARLEFPAVPADTEMEPLYTHPAPQRQPQESDAYRYALGLASSIWSRHYKDTAPGWKPLDDLVGLLSQIDNMVTGLVRQEKAALAEPTGKPSLQVEPQEPVAWQSVTEALPTSGVKVLACYRNRLGNLRRIRAQWVAAKTEEANADDAEACSEYDEATDTYYVAQGWYECIDNWGDYSSVAVTEGEVTHWMPLPPAPEAVPAHPAPQRQPLTEYEAWEIWDALADRGKKGEDIVHAFARAVEKAHGIGGKE